MKRKLNYFFITFLCLFGVLNIFLTSSIILDLFNVRARVGNFVPFVVWINFFTGFNYVLATYGFIKLKQWTKRILIINLFILILGFIAFFFYINLGGIYKYDTIFALLFRITFTLIAILFSYSLIKKESYNHE
ncbi:MAG: hypothetical protein U0457_13620 [Candidatus Sericytochromatia bacterium]